VNDCGGGGGGGGGGGDCDGDGCGGGSGSGGAGDGGGGGGVGGGDDVDNNEVDRIAKYRTLFTMPNVRCFFRSVVSINNIFSLVWSVLTY